MLEIIVFTLKIFLFLTLLIVVFHVFATHLIVYYETRLSALQKGELPVYPWQLIIKSFFIEIFCNIMRFFLLPFANITHKNVKAHTENTTLPIILVHGYLQNQTDWFWFRRQLEKKKIGPVYSLNLQTHDASIRKLAETLQNKIIEIQNQTPCDKVILIGHSMGGLICSYYTEFLAKNNEVLMSIALGSPFLGTRLAAFGKGEHVIEMLPESSFLKNLYERMRQSPQKYFYVASKIDNLISPWQSAIPHYDNDDKALENANDHCLILEDYGHLRFLISPKVIQQIISWIHHQKNV